MFDFLHASAEIFAGFGEVGVGDFDDERRAEAALEMEDEFGPDVVRDLDGAEVLEFAQAIVFGAVEHEALIVQVEVDHAGKPSGPNDDQHFGDENENAEQEISLPDGEGDECGGDDDGDPIPRDVAVAFLEFRRLPMEIERSDHIDSIADKNERTNMKRGEVWAKAY